MFYKRDASLVRRFTYVWHCCEERQKGQRAEGRGQRAEMEQPIQLKAIRLKLKQKHEPGKMLNN
jgi:hypothetical protein